MNDRPLVFYDAEGAAYQPVKHSNRVSGRSAYRVKPKGASNRTEDFLELDTVEELARAMLVDGLPARVKALDNTGSVSVLRFGAEALVRYELDPGIARRLGISATSAGGSAGSTAGLSTLRQSACPDRAGPRLC